MSHVLGLTGGIASGKSTVSKYFKKLGFPVIDADIIAREIMEKDRPTYLKVVDCFGEDILNADRSINRRKLGDLVFNDAEKLHQLNALVQKDIFKKIMEKRNSYIDDDHSLIIMDIPLLYETGYDKLVDEVMVVYADPATQLSRLMKRDNVSEKDALSRIHSQESLELKKNKADIVINNNGTLEETLLQIKVWLRKKGYSLPM